MSAAGLGRVKTQELKKYVERSATPTPAFSKATRNSPRRWNTIPLRERTFWVFTRPGSKAVQHEASPRIKVLVRLSLDYRREVSGLRTSS